MSGQLHVLGKLLREEAAVTLVLETGDTKGRFGRL
jgi:hypothetical protein